MRKSKKLQGGATVSQLQELQTLVVNALTKEIQLGMETGEMSQAAIKNALQLLKENNIVATDDTLSEVDRLASLLPDLEPVSFTSIAERY